MKFSSVAVYVFLHLILEDDLTVDYFNALMYENDLNASFSHVGLFSTGGDED